MTITLPDGTKVSMEEFLKTIPHSAITEEIDKQILDAIRDASIT